MQCEHAAAVAALYVLGIAGAFMLSERLSRYRPVAASFVGGAMTIIGLVLLEEAAAPGPAAAIVTASAPLPANSRP